MRVALWIVFAVNAIAAAILLGQLAWQIVPQFRAWYGPDLEGPAFRLEPGAVGTWDPVWPLDFGGRGGELEIETDPPWTEPDSFAVLVVAEPVELCEPCGDFVGSPTPWLERGLGVLPTGSQRARELSRRGSSPLCMTATGPARIEWTVVDVSTEFLGAETRLVVRYPGPTRSAVIASLRNPCGIHLGPAFVMILCAVVAALALRHGRSCAVVAVRPRVDECV